MDTVYGKATSNRNKLKEKIQVFESLNCDDVIRAEHFRNALEECGALKANYNEYMTTRPIDCDAELSRLPKANYDLCCALLTMLLREDYFSNGSFEMRQKRGQVKPIIERILSILSSVNSQNMKEFSEKSISALNGYYVYALVDPRDDKIFYVGKGRGNRVFSHEKESDKSQRSEKEKLKKIREIEKDGFSVKRLLVNWGLSESEAFVGEATLINVLNYMPDMRLTNEASGHHVHQSLTTEEFERLHGAVHLKSEDIKHSILVIKINKLYRRDLNEEELYEVVRGYWSASIKSIKARKVKYVFGVYNGLIVSVYKPDEWHYGYEMIEHPQIGILKTEDYERIKNRVYFKCNDYRNLDDEGKFYLYKSIVDLKFNQSAQNPITYLSPLE